MSDFDFDVEKYPILASFPERKMVQTVPDGFEAETLPCTLFLLGISSPPKNIRGWIEALGAGIEIKKSDLIFRTSWVEMDDNGIAIGFRDAPQNLLLLQNAQYYSLGGYKGLLIIPEQANCASSTHLIPAFEIFGKNVKNFVYPDILGLRDAVSRLQEIESNTSLLPWAASSAVDLPSFPQKAAVVTGTNVVKGIAKALHMDLVTSAEMTGDIDTNLNIKVSLTLDLAKEYPFVLLHIGGCDEASHRMNRWEKETFLKKIDTIVLPMLLDSNHTIEVVSDHGSDPETGKHIGGKQQLFRRATNK